MLIKCNKTGEEYEITDREVGEKIECPCCGEKYVVDENVIPADDYAVCIVRKTAAIAAIIEISFDENVPQSNVGQYEELFNRAYGQNDAAAQVKLARILIETEKEPELGRFWFEQAARQGCPEAEFWMAERYYQRGILDTAQRYYETAARHGHALAKSIVEKIIFSEWGGCTKGAGKSIYERALLADGKDKKFGKCLCDKYGVRAVYPYWADKAMPEYGSPSGTSYIIGSFKEEKDVPRDLLSEISHLIGMKLQYSGRYIDTGIPGETKFLFCYAVCPFVDDSGDRENSGSSHAMDVKLQIPDDSDDISKLRLIWRETIDMNCPLCEAKLKLQTRLLGGLVRCPLCNKAFMAKGEGIMTTEERKECRDEANRCKEKKTVEDTIYGKNATGRVISSLRLMFGVKACDVSNLTVGGSFRSPWPGLYIDVVFQDHQFNNAAVPQIKNLLSKSLGYAMWLVDVTHDWCDIVRFYVRKDRPCEQDEHVKTEIEMIKKENYVAKYNRGKECVHPIVKSREKEEDRLTYLLFGEGEESVNRFDFYDYLKKKFHDFILTGFFINNQPPGESWTLSCGFKDGFGVVIRSEHPLTVEALSMLKSDLEKRFSRLLSLVKIRGRKPVDYCFSVLQPKVGNGAPSRMSSSSPNQVGQFTQKQQTRMEPMKTTIKPTAVQHIGKGLNIDWTRENQVFSSMIARYGISKFKVEMVNPFCSEICIPLSANANAVRKFANDLFHELDVLDADCNLDFGQHTDCSVLDLDADSRCCYIVFNHHDVKEASYGDPLYKYKVEAISGGCGDEDGDDSDEPADSGLTPAQIMKYIADGIRSGALRSKSGEGYFVLKGEFYDAIEAGRKTTEYRDLTPRNLAKSIGIKTVKLQRGYGHPGQPPEQMRFEVASVGLLDADDRECDPYAIPPGFIATTIAIHLGKRI